jgi:hypothetical protein
MVALARNLDFLGSRILAGLTTVFIARLRRTPAWQVRAFVLFICRHNRFPFLTLGFRNPSLHNV